MAIDINHEVFGTWLYKWISVKKLRELLAQLPEGADLVPNQVGNINIFVPIGDGQPAKGQFMWYGYIDVSSEEICEVTE